MNMPYIDTKHLFKCETCRFYRNGKCNTFCDAGEAYSPSLTKIPAADVISRDEVRRIFEEIEQEIVAALESNYRVYEEHLEKYGDKPNLELLCMCNAKVNALRGIEDFIAEIKKKYTKGE